MGVDPGFRLCHISNVNADEKFTFSFWWVYRGGGQGIKSGLKPKVFKFPMRGSLFHFGWVWA